MPAHTTPRIDATFLFRKKGKEKDMHKARLHILWHIYMPTTAFHLEYEHWRLAK